MADLPIDARGMGGSGTGVGAGPAPTTMSALMARSGGQRPGAFAPQAQGMPPGLFEGVLSLMARGLPFAQALALAVRQLQGPQGAAGPPPISPGSPLPQQLVPGIPTAPLAPPGMTAPPAMFVPGASPPFGVPSMPGGPGMINPTLLQLLARGVR